MAGTVDDSAEARDSAPVADELETPESGVAGDPLLSGGQFPLMHHLDRRDRGAGRWRASLEGLMSGRTSTVRGGSARSSGEKHPASQDGSQHTGEG